MAAPTAEWSGLGNKMTSPDQTQRMGTPTAPQRSPEKGRKGGVKWNIQGHMLQMVLIELMYSTMSLSCELTDFQFEWVV